MADRTSIREDRARAVIDGITALVRDFPDDSLALWAMAQELRIIAGLTTDQPCSTAADPGQ